MGSLFAGRIWAKLTVLRWNTPLSAASSGSRALKIYIVPMDFKIFILDSRYITKPSFSAARLIACMIGTKSTYTPSTAWLVDSQRVLEAFHTFFATTDPMFSDSFILHHNSCTFTTRAVCVGDLVKGLLRLGCIL